MLHGVVQCLKGKLDPEMSNQLRQEVIREVQENGRLYAPVSMHDVLNAQIILHRSISSNSILVRENKDLLPSMATVTCWCRICARLILNRINN